MAKEIKTKSSFGTVTVDHYSPALPGELPVALNIHISFEEAMRLHLGLGQALAKLNSYKRSTREGKRSALNLCLYPHAYRITINEGRANAETN